VTVVVVPMRFMTCGFPVLALSLFPYLIGSRFRSSGCRTNRIYAELGSENDA
jgi:hypothetical protein